MYIIRTTQVKCVCYVIKGSTKEETVISNTKRHMMIKNIKLQTHPKGFGLCVSKECSWQRLFFLLLGMESIMLFNFDLQQEKAHIKIKKQLHHIGKIIQINRQKNVEA